MNKWTNKWMNERCDTVVLILCTHIGGVAWGSCTIVLWSLPYDRCVKQYVHTVLYLDTAINQWAEPTTCHQCITARPSVLYTYQHFYLYSPLAQQCYTCRCTIVNAFSPNIIQCTYAFRSMYYVWYVWCTALEHSKFENMFKIMTKISQKKDVHVEQKI